MRDLKKYIKKCKRNDDLQRKIVGEFIIFNYY